MGKAAMKTAFLFPGQGAQRVGMGRDVHEQYAAAKRIFAEAERATSLPLTRLCFEGPEDELSRTDIAQPAIFAVSAALLEAMRDYLTPAQMDAIEPAEMAGLSLGEYTALYAAGAMDFVTGVKLVARRGELMQQAATAVESGMVSILGLDEERARELCAAASDGEVLVCANFNCPGQVVLSGQAGACDRAEALAGDFGATGAVRLKVAGAFHSEIMSPAAEKFTDALAEVDFRQPKVPIISNVDCRPYDGADEIRAKLAAQLTSPVRWEQSMKNLLSGGTRRFYEIGPGRVLAGLMRRIDRDVKVVGVQSRDDVNELAQDQAATPGRI